MRPFPFRDITVVSGILRERRKPQWMKLQRKKGSGGGVEEGFPAASVVRFLLLPVVCLAVRHGPRAGFRMPQVERWGMVRFLCFLTLFADRDK